MSTSANMRVLSGMRPTGKLHLGHYHGVLKNWLSLQEKYECFFFVADWHALTTVYEDPSKIEKYTMDMIVDWLAVGINPGTVKLFVQSRIPEHAELHLLLSMCTPLSWLERVPSYKDQQEKLSTKDLTTYGFLGYPLLQTSDILMYKAGYIPVGEDQLSHVELAREVVRRFNYLYGREPDFLEKIEHALKKIGKKNAKLYIGLRDSYQEEGNIQALEKARALLDSQQNISIGDRERLFGYLDGVGKAIFPEPEALLTSVTKMPGLDGNKMSNSYNNIITLCEHPTVVEEKINKMPTDPARIRRTDPGEPNKCPVWGFHDIYSTEDLKKWVKEGCTTAKIGCLDCKKPLVESILKEQAPIRQRADEYKKDPDTILGIIAEGCDSARSVARETLDEVKDEMGLGYF